MFDPPFGFDRPEDSPGFSLWQATIIWQRLIKKALDPYNISHSQFVIMALLLWFKAHNYDTTQTLIINWSKLDKMTVSKSLKKLVAQGLVHRFELKTDTRAKSVFLTDKGKDLVYQLVPIVEKIDAEFFGKVLERDKQLLIQILKKLVADS
ncbi:MarR family winged helix-turn-helix transcriptional regulator [Candidatus Paracaedibacter symbiosus]|uniref:MarR family winged helix-turn-helix transcriptional regulator n=1 Tax=Candidatus Paracaedibacter symbiosus TaxID=244582 RepID=UPI0005095FA2|nr:MarR family winged helix-turn-helix transcriptional regulator [Candidatus Paracaedibacter symbiosus]